MPNLLITSAGRRVSLVRFFKKELKHFFPESKVIAADQHPEFSAAVQVADKAIRLPPVQSETYINSLLEKCLENEIKLIIPTIDTELLVLSRNKNLFLRHDITPLVSSPEFVTICSDKRNTHVFFNQIGISVAKEFSKENYTLPIFIKPVNGSASLYTQIIKHKDEISKSQLKDDTLMFLEYLSKNEHSEFTCDLYYNKNHSLTCVIPRKRIATRGGEISKGITKRNLLVEYIKKNLAIIPGAIGCITTQFFVHNLSDKIYGIEINPRFGGGYPLSYLAGGNYPKWIIEEYFFNKSIKPFDDWKENMLMLRYDDEIIIQDFDE